MDKVLAEIIMNQIVEGRSVREILRFMEWNYSACEETTEAYAARVLYDVALSIRPELKKMKD